MKLFTLGVAGLALVGAHYADPNVAPGCASDEQKVQITNIPGDLCSPQCVGAAQTCPTDVPTGVTATPNCALKSPQGDGFCALICVPGSNANTCGENASCKVAGSSGLCTYDDGAGPSPPPGPPASSKHWAPVDSPTFQENSVVLSVSFEKNGKVGYAGAGSNGAGAQVIKSEDSGVTWAPVYPAAGGAPSMNIFLAAATKDEKSVVVSGVIDQMYSTDGTLFNTSTDDFFSPAQDAGITPAGNYALTVEGSNLTNGVAISSDGKTWTTQTPIDFGDNFPARYADFPTEDTWYVTLGDFPENAAQKLANTRKKAKALNQHVTVHADQTLHFTPRATTNDDPDEGFFAGIAKTTDGGKTWTEVFKSSNKGIYANGISCGTVNDCVAVVEGNKAQILTTHDGGKTWKVVMDDEDPASSLITVHMLSATEGWAAGGHLSAAAFEGRYWHTLDGGDTWTKEAIPDLYIISLDMVSAESAYSVALTIESGVQLMKYKKASVQMALA